MLAKRDNDSGASERPTDQPTHGGGEVTGALNSGSPPRPLLGTRLGMFGGSFDPIHMGHLHVARVACEAFDLDHVLFVPARRPPHKPGRVLAPDADRLAMVQLAIAGDRRWGVSSMELEREGPSFTIDTLKSLPSAVYGRPQIEGLALHLILGSDNLVDFPNWHRADEILAVAQPIIVLREEDPIPEPAWFEALDPGVRARIEAGILRIPPAPGRSTDLRRAIQQGALLDEWLPDGVGEYIRAHALYTCDAPL
ncbi:MAG: nicotinate-nucleotide adenylyltransferase [Planctomycetota bacterium]|jgi:nicotinate-nucleotide adenylyltransferase